MFSRLKKMLGKSAETTVPAAVAPLAEPTFTQAAFVRREAVFDRDNRLSGHLFRMQQASAVADADLETQRDYDQQLFDTLNASTEAWNRTPTFLPISSASLDSPALEHLVADKVVLLLQLAPDADADVVGTAIEQLRKRGFQFGLFRQPRNPAYAKVIQKIEYAAIDVAGSEPGSIRDFSAAVRSGTRTTPLQLLACNVETIDDQQLCLQWHFSNCHGKFAEQPAATRNAPSGDPHKTQLLNLLRLVQGEAETAEIAAAMKLDPMLSFRILRYLNSPILAMSRQIDSLEQALMILGRQRLTRWLAVLLFSVREPQLSDWLLVENALTRGRLMEILAEQKMPGQPHDPLFLTGIFSCLHRLLHRPLADILGTLPIAEEIRRGLLERSGPYAALLAVAEAAESVDQGGMAKAAQAAGVTADAVNGALLAATAWASEVTEYWE